MSTEGIFKPIGGVIVILIYLVFKVENLKYSAENLWEASIKVVHLHVSLLKLNDNIITSCNKL